MGISHLERIEIERTRYITLLGIRFWDPIYNCPISCGLTVCAWPKNNPEAQCEAIASNAGVYSFQGLSGLRNFEHANYYLLESLINQRKFIFKVKERKDRFLPTAFCLDLPRSVNGVFPMDVPFSNPGLWPGIPLFSTPTRLVSGNQATLRANLIDKRTQKAAAHALVCINFNGNNWYGIANQDGSVAVHFPYSALAVNAPISSSIETAFIPIENQSWNIQLSIFYTSTGLSPLPGTNIPDQKDIFAQPAVKIITSFDDPPIDIQTYSLNYKQDLILKTTGKSELFLET